MSGDVLKVATFNANSIRARMDQILEWMDQEHTDVLCVQETKVQDEDFPEDAIRDAGYFVIYRGQKSHAGVAIISSMEPEDAKYGFDDEGEPDKPRLIRATYAGVPVVNTYVPQGRSVDSEHFRYKLEWFDRIRELFDRYYEPGSPLLWMGDFNVAPKPIDIYDPQAKANHVDFHPDVREALANVKDWGFTDVFRLHHPDEAGQYTYYDYRAKDPIERGVGWRVDHIWATEPLANVSTQSWIDIQARQVERPSDHTFLVASFDLSEL